MEKFIVIGGGGHSASVRSSVEKQRIVAVLDNPKDDERMSEFGVKYFHVAIGDNHIRHNKTKECMARGFLPITIIDKSASVAEDAKVGEGCFIGRNSVVCANVAVGKNCIINSGAIIEHCCVVMDNTHCAPGSVLCGGVQVGQFCMIGANATVLPRVKIVDNVTVGAGSVVTKDITVAGTYVGVPAALVKKGK
jgi:sugar O-acyltransferase (sialic acid O-acetyltransferase NeuD family)